MDELARRGKELYNEGTEKLNKALDFCAREEAEKKATGVS